jgi:hypothetical protein
MNWQESVIDYCERLDGRLWSEPLNALSNGAFLIAAAAAFALLRQRRPKPVTHLLMCSTNGHP